MSLSDRLRPDCEAAPWVIEEIKKLEAENIRFRNALQEIVNKGPASPGDKKHEIAYVALAVKQTKERLKDTLAFIESVEKLND